MTIVLSALPILEDHYNSWLTLRFNFEYFMIYFASAKYKGLQGIHWPKVRVKI